MIKFNQYSKYLKHLIISGLALITVIICIKTLGLLPMTFSAHTELTVSQMYTAELESLGLTTGLLISVLFLEKGIYKATNYVIKRMVQND